VDTVTLGRRSASRDLPGGGCRDGDGETAASVGVSTGVIGKCTARAEKAGLDWAAAEALDDVALERRGTQEAASAGGPRAAATRITHTLSAPFVIPPETCCCAEF
jgi:hypothetical protein